MAHLTLIKDIIFISMKTCHATSLELPTDKVSSNEGLQRPFSWMKKTPQSYPNASILGYQRIINFRFGTNGKLMFLGVPLIGHFRITSTTPLTCSIIFRKANKKTFIDADKGVYLNTNSTLLHSEGPKVHGGLAVLSAIGLR